MELVPRFSRSLALFVIFAISFFVRQRRAPEPLLPISVLANQVILTATMACALVHRHAPSG